MRIDISHITANIAIDIKLTEEQVQDVTTKVTLDLQRALMLKTPKDTGRAARGWVATTPSTPYEHGVVENNVEYIGKLNDGHSKQAPAGFVEASIQDVADRPS